jgi:hypothetical protein
MFLFDQNFDIAIIYLLRKMAKNFLLINREIHLDGIPFENAVKPDSISLDDYI